MAQYHHLLCNTSMGMNHPGLHHHTVQIWLGECVESSVSSLDWLWFGGFEVRRYFIGKKSSLVVGGICQELHEAEQSWRILMSSILNLLVSLPLCSLFTWAEIWVWQMLVSSIVRKFWITIALIKLQLTGAGKRRGSIRYVWYRCDNHKSTWIWVLVLGAASTCHRYLQDQGILFLPIWFIIYYIIQLLLLIYTSQLSAHMLICLLLPKPQPQSHLASPPPPSTTHHPLHQPHPNRTHTQTHMSRSQLVDKPGPRMCRMPHVVQAYCLNDKIVRCLTILVLSLQTGM